MDDDPHLRADAALRVPRVPAESAVRLVVDRAWTIVAVRGAAVAHLGTPRAQLLGRGLWEVFPGDECDGMRLGCRHAAELGTAAAFVTFRPERRRWLEVEVMPRPRRAGGLAFLLRDVTDQRLAAGALAGQNRILRRLAAGEPLGVVLDALCRHLEGLMPQAICSVMLLDPARGCLRPVSAPNLPPSYVELLEAYCVAPGPCAGSCGTAVHERRPVIVVDVLRDPLWAAYREIIAAYPLRACWSVPIVDATDDDRVLGTFAVYLPEPATPAAADLRVVAEASYLAGLAIRTWRTQEALQRSEERFRSLVQNGVDVFGILDATGHVLYVSPAVTRQFGYLPEEVVGAVAFDFVHEAQREQFEAAFHALLGSGAECSTHILQGRHRDGSWRWMEVQLNDRAADPSVGGVVFTVRDITERRQTEEALRLQAELLDQALAAVFATDSRGIVTHWNRHAETLYGWRRVEVVGRPVASLRLPADVVDLATIVGHVRPGQRWEGEVTARRRDGSRFPVYATISPTMAGADATGFVVVAVDLTERKRVERDLERLATTDLLTGLPNRGVFVERLGQALANLAAREGAVAVLFLDLDDFKVVNDGLGHVAGDMLLAAVGRRLRGCVGEAAVLARFGGDEFTILLDRIGDETTPQRLADRIIEALRVPFQLDGHEVVVSPSIGIAISGDPMQPPDDLLRSADIAMYEAKRRGKALHATYTPAMNDGVMERLELVRDLRRAIAAGELTVCYQPVVDLVSGELEAVEALVRWEHPSQGVVPPARFVPLAEETGLILAIDRLVMSEACRALRDWRARYGEHAPARVAVNLGARTLQRATLLDEIGAILAGCGVEPSCLELELTERVALDRSPGTVAILDELRRRGIGLTIDDFGTGYSGLSAFKHCPAGTLKIAREFTVGLAARSTDAKIVAAVISFARAMRLQTVAEGVETLAQASLLRALGCGLAQGHFFAPPVTAAELEDLLATRWHWSAAATAGPEEASRWVEIAAGSH